MVIDITSKPRNSSNGRFKDTINTEYVNNYAINNKYKAIILNIEERTLKSGRKIKDVIYICACNKQSIKTWDNFKKSELCHECAKLKGRPPTKYTTELVESIIISKNYKWLNKNEYRDASSLLQLQCNVCNLIIKTNICSLQDGRKCKKCSGLSRKTTEEFKQEVTLLSNGEYSLLSEYEHGKVKVLIRHNVCNEEYWVKPINFITGKRCPKCLRSKGESFIFTFLKEKSIQFIEQYKFSNCKNKKELPFDFAILDKNNNVKLLIEYDGIQHFEPIEHFGGDEGFKKTKNNDSIKNTYCINNKIPLIRIPYWEYENLENILLDVFYGEKECHFEVK